MGVYFNKYIGGELTACADTSRARSGDVWFHQIGVNASLTIDAPDPDTAAPAGGIPGNVTIDLRGPAEAWFGMAYDG